MKRIKVLAVVFIAVFALAMFAACNAKTDEPTVGNAFDLLSKEEIEHIVGYCATFTQKKGTSAWWEYRYFGSNEYEANGLPGECVEISIIPSDNSEETNHDLVDFLYFFKDEETAKKFVDFARELDANDDYSEDREYREYLIDDTHVYMTSYIYDNKTHERIGAVTPEEQREFYTQKVQKAMLPSTFSKARFDFIIEAIQAGLAYVSIDLTIDNEYEYDDWGVYRKDTYEEFECMSMVMSGKSGEPNVTTIDYEYMYWSDGVDYYDIGWGGWDKHIDEIKQNGNTEDRYIDIEREKGFSFYMYKEIIQDEGE